MAAARSSSTPTVSAAAMARSAGRLAAIQALYQIEVSELTSDGVLKDFISGRQGGMAIVDFNRAYNPPCAFSPYATCPLPLKQNQLPVAIEAGEHAYHFD